MTLHNENRTYAIFNVSELNLIDFSQVLETSVDTIRKSVDETKTFVKWSGDIQPTCISTLTTIHGTYTYTDMIAIMGTDNWYTDILV